MTSHVEQSSSVAEICEGVKRLGYGASQSIRLYGEEFEVISSLSRTSADGSMKVLKDFIGPFVFSGDGKAVKSPN